MGLYHAVKSPSSANRWGGREACTASIGAQRSFTGDTGSDASRRGTCGHQMCAEMLLDESIDPQFYLGRVMEFHAGEHESWLDMGELRDDNKLLGSVVVDQTLIDECMSHVLYVRERVALTGGELFVEQSVPIDHITGEVGATGSCDIGIIYGDTVEVVDLKLGRGQVDAYEAVVPAHEDVISGEMVHEVIEPNEQIAMYASGFMHKLDLMYDFKNVILTISQPPLGRLSQWSGTVEEMNVVIDRLRIRARECDTNPVFRPSKDNCHFCRASGNCAAQNEMVLTAALEGFEDATQEPRVRTPADVTLGDAYELTGLVRTWLKAVEQRVYGALQTGQRVVRSDGIGYKLVIGKKGDREWKNPAEVEALMRKMRLKTDQMYTFKLISPAGAEKLAKVPKVKKGEQPIAAPIGTIQWNRLAAQITQDEGKPSIVLETDPRPAVASAADGFGDVAPADDISDLL